MNKEQRLKLVGYFIVAVLVLNVILFAFRIIDVIVFWGVIIIGALFAWKAIPYLKKKSSR